MSTASYFWKCFAWAFVSLFVLVFVGYATLLLGVPWLFKPAQFLLAPIDLLDTTFFGPSYNKADFGRSIIFIPLVFGFYALIFATIVTIWKKT